MSTSRGGPAFPVQGEQTRQFTDDGMTLRDYFAAKAMQGIIAAQVGNDAITSLGEEYIADSAYSMADAMLLERAQ